MDLLEFIDIKILQHIQDGFSDAFELPSIIYDNTGQPITRPSRFTKFCTFVRSTEKGNANCQKFDALLMKELVDKKNPTIRHGCALKNIITATVPIIINDIHLANFGIGQAIEDDFDFSEIKEYAQEIGVDEDKLLEAAKTLIPVNESLLQNSIKFLHVVATQISALGYQNLQNKKLIEKVAKLNQNLEKRIEERTAELTEANIKLQQSLDEVKTLQGIIPICAYCKKVRDDKGAWEIIEAYIHTHSDAEFSHGVCPECYDKVIGDIRKQRESQ